MRRLALALAVAVGLLGCRKLFRRGAPDASATALDEGDGGCVRPVHPGYCRHACRSFAARSASMSARRVPRAARAGVGKCGDFDVFAADEKPGDGGVASGVVEYFDHESGNLVAAVDTRLWPCDEFGTVPKCTPSVAWAESPLQLKVRTGLVSLGSPTTLTIETVERIVRVNYGRFGLCYRMNKQLTKDGTVVTKVDVAKDGSVKSAKKTSSDLGDSQVESCVERAFANMSFPALEGPVTVTIPLVFEHQR